MKAQAEPQTFRVSQVARILGVTPNTIRVWEAQGLIPPAARTLGGHRRYTQKDIDRIRRLMRPGGASRAA